jgi:hypothetical protein
MKSGSKYIFSGGSGIFGHKTPRVTRSSFATPIRIPPKSDAGHFSSLRQIKMAHEWAHF